jgi:uncharacterized protein (TIRG00374 family)
MSNSDFLRNKRGGDFRTESVVAREPQRFSFVKLVVGGLVFLVLTIGIFWYQFNRIQALDEVPILGQLKWCYLFLMLLCLPIDTLVSGFRILAVCRVLQPGIRLWTCLKAELANMGIAMLTPSSSGGGIGQVYILNRGGASLGTAISISLITFLGTMVALPCLGLFSLFFSGIQQIGPFFAGAAWCFTLVTGAMVLGVAWPGLFRTVVSLISRAFQLIWGKDDRLEDWWPPGKARTGPPIDRVGPLSRKVVDLIYTYRDDVRRFMQLGRANFVLVCLLSFAFIFSRALMGFLCLRFLGIQQYTIGHILEVQLSLIFLIYFAPTPGGSGLAEGTSLFIMANIVPIGFAPHYNLLWRFSTLYLPACVGLFFFIRTVLRDAPKIIERRYIPKLRKKQPRNEDVAH